jgi:hypothetical protein
MVSGWLESPPPSLLRIGLAEQRAQLIQSIGLKGALLAPNHREPEGPVGGGQVILPQSPGLAFAEIKPHHSTVRTDLIVQRHGIAQEPHRAGQGLQPLALGAGHQRFGVEGEGRGHESMPVGDAVQLGHDPLPHRLR